MSTPTNQQAGKEKKPAPKSGQTTPANKTTPRNTSAAPKPGQPAQRPTQSAAKTPQATPKTTSQATPKAGTASAPKAAAPAAPKATPPAPKPRDPSVVQRDARREERRLEIQARQQERRQELRQAKRQKLLIRYDLIIAPILLLILVPLFLLIHLPIEALISGLVIVFGGFSVLAYAAVGMPTRSARPARPRPSSLPEADVVDSTLNQDAPPPAATEPASETENPSAKE
jgi:hypothetical protein